MSEEYKNNFVILTDEEGNEKEFEHIDTLEDNGTVYLAFIPAELNLEEEAEVVIMRVDSDDMLVAVEDDDLADAIYEQVMDNIDEAMYSREAEANSEDE